MKCLDNMNKIVYFPHAPQPSGGPGTFQHHLTDELEKRGWSCRVMGTPSSDDVILVVGGTRRFWDLIVCRIRRVPVVYRLDGLRWSHKAQPTAFKIWLLFHMQNFLLFLIRKFIATSVVYQTEFIQKWWHREHGPSGVNEYIIWNATDLDLFFPKDRRDEAGPPRIICAEGNFPHEHDTVELMRRISKDCISKGLVASVDIYGGVDDKTREELNIINGIVAHGKCPRDEMPRNMRESDIFLSLECNPPCPNSVIEAIASGLPVVGFKTGSLVELLGPCGDYLVEHGGDPWKMDRPNHASLIDSLIRLSSEYVDAGKQARAYAEENYSRQNMTEQYIAVLTASSKA